MSVVWLALVVSTAQLPAQVQHQYEPQNAGCAAITTAAPACDQTYAWQDVALKCERKYDACVIDLKASQAKLENHLVPPPPVVETVGEIPTWVIVVGAIAVAGAFVGGVYAGLRVAGSSP